MIRHLLIRNKRLVSEELQNLEIDRIKDPFLRKGYPIKFITNEIEKLQKLEDKPQLPKQQYLTVTYIIPNVQVTWIPNILEKRSDNCLSELKNIQSLQIVQYYHI